MVRADYVSQSVTLDQSNTLKDGVAYGSVLVEAYDGVGAAGGGLKAGEVRLTYSANMVADYASASKTFGIDHMGFNTDLKLTAGQITSSAGWKINDNKNLSAFGKFSWAADGNAKGGDRPNPTSLLITGLGANAKIGHFMIATSGSEGNVYFAMHVAGFTSASNPNVGSHWVGGSSLVTEIPPPEGSGEGPPPPSATPEPTTILLGVFGFGGLWIGRALRRRL
jgi:hypothetical protein